MFGQENRRYSRTACLAFSLALGMTVAQAAPADNLKVIATLTGVCKNAMAMDVATDPALCQNKVVNFEFPNGRLGFVFVLQKKGSKDVAVVSFFGHGKQQLHLNPDTAMQPIDRVHFTFEGATDDLVAAGSCRFSNPYKGKPSLISCTADTNKGKFAGEFVSDGRPPNISQTR